MDKTNTKDITPHCSNAMLCAAFLSFRKWVSNQLVRVANKVYKEREIVPRRISLKIEEVKSLLSQAVEQGLISQEEMNSITGYRQFRRNESESQKEVKEMFMDVFSLVVKYCATSKHEEFGGRFNRIMEVLLQDGQPNYSLSSSSSV